MLDIKAFFSGSITLSFFISSVGASHQKEEEVDLEHAG